MTFPPYLRGARAAFVFLTRLRVGGFPYRKDDFRWAPAYFPFVGTVVGSFGLGVWLLARPLGALLAATLSVLLTVYLTGAFHEDGLADTADALGGAHGKQRILEILKDSRVGTYGASALVFSLLLRVASLAALSENNLLLSGHSFSAAVVALPFSHTLARVSPVFLMRYLPYASESGAKGGTVAEGGKTPQLLVASVYGALASFLLYCLGVSPRILGLAWALSAGIALELGRRFMNATGGFTGDFLGATEQVTEISLLLLFVAETTP